MTVQTLNRFLFAFVIRWSFYLRCIKATYIFLKCSCKKTNESRIALPQCTQLTSAVGKCLTRCDWNNHLKWPKHPASLSLPTEQDHLGPSDIQRGSFPSLSGGAFGEHHQWCRAHGRLVLHAWWPPWAHRGWVQRSATGPSRLAERVHEQREFSPRWCLCLRPSCICKDFRNADKFLVVIPLHNMLIGDNDTL